MASGAFAPDLSSNLAIYGKWLMEHPRAPIRQPTWMPTKHGSKKDHDAMIQISTSLKKGPFNIIAGASSSKECWDKLTDRF